MMHRKIIYDDDKIVPYYSTADDLWKDLDWKIKANWMITAQTSGANGLNHDSKDDLGIAYLHAYSVLGTEQLSNGQKLIMVRNPWGREDYHGDWSDWEEESDLWTDAFKAEIDYVQANDGVWYITAEDFYQHMEQTTSNPDI